MFTPQDLTRMMPCTLIRAMEWHPSLVAAAQEFHIDTPMKVAGWLATVAHESGRLGKMVEDLYYRTPQALMRTWPSRFPTVESALPYVKNQQKLANKVYANRMGNGPEASGDGWRHRGVGPIQMTGKSNQTECAHALGIPLDELGTQLVLPKQGSRSAAWFWYSRRCNEAMAVGDFELATRRVNGGLIGYEDGNSTGLDDRVELFENNKHVLKVTA